jgi:CheY-like chemotaxis protein
MTKKIMVVDDDPGVIYTIVQGLGGLGSNYEISIAENGKKCLELLEKDHIPDLIILDILMPEMTGWETYQKIRETLTGEELPIIFLTSRTDQVARKAGGFLGEDYIEKPFKIPELKQKIENILSKK